MTRHRDAGREYAGIWGEAVQANRRLRTLAILLAASCVLLGVILLRLAGAEPPRPTRSIPRPSTSSTGSSTTSTRAAAPPSRSTGPGASGSCRPSSRMPRSRGTAPKSPPWPPGPPTPNSRSSRSCSASTRRPKRRTARRPTSISCTSGTNRRSGASAGRSCCGSSSSSAFPPSSSSNNPMGILITYLRADRALVTE